MKEPPKKPSSKPPAPVVTEDLVEEFRAYLHRVTTATLRRRARPA